MFSLLLHWPNTQYPAVLIAGRLKWDLRLKFGENLKWTCWLTLEGDSFQKRRLWTQEELNQTCNWSKITGNESRYYWETSHSFSWLWLVTKSILHWSFITAWPAKLRCSSTTFQEGNKPKHLVKWNSKQDNGNAAIRGGVLFYFRHYLVRNITSRNRFHEKPKSHMVPAPIEQNHCGEEDKYCHYHYYLELWLLSQTKQHHIPFTK